jgi:hypothetical protein
MALLVTGSGCWIRRRLILIDVSNFSVQGRTTVSACPYWETANRALPVMDISIILNAHLYRVTYVRHSIVCFD